MNYPASYIHWLRQRVGHRKVFLAYSSVVVFDENGRFLLQKRTDFNVWGLPGGVLELDEDIATCARRELAEETGLTIGELRLVGVYTHPDYDVVYPNGDQVQQFTICVAGRVNGGAMRVDGTENSQQAFFSATAMANVTVPIWYRAMLADALARQAPVFEPPYSNGRLIDQIATIRPLIGTEWYTGIGTIAMIMKNGRLLMAQWPGADFWVFPGGYAHLGENIAHAVVREVAEETGLTIMPERIVGIYSAPRYHYTYPNGDKVKAAGVLFQGRLVSGTPQLETSEITRLEWVDPADLLNRVDPAWQSLFSQALAHLETGYFID